MKELGRKHKCKFQENINLFWWKLWWEGWERAHNQRQQIFKGCNIQVSVYWYIQKQHQSKNITFWLLLINFQHVQSRKIIRWILTA